VKPAHLCALIASTALATTAAAQTTLLPARFEIERLQLDPAARGSLVLGTGEIAPAHSFRLSLAYHREHRPLVFVEPDDVLGRRSGEKLVGDRDTLHLTLDYVLFPRVEVYGRANFIVNQDGFRSYDAGWGTPSFGVRVGALQQSAGSALDVAVAAELFPPWGDASLFAKPAEASGLFRLELGRDLGKSVVLGVQAGYLIQQEQIIGRRAVGDEVQYGVVIAGKGTIRPELSYRGAFDVEGDEGPGTGELLGGLRANVGVVEVFGVGGPGFFNRVGTPKWRALVGVALRLDAKKAEPAPEPAPVAAPPPAVAPPPPPPPPEDPCAPGMAHTPEQCPALDDDGDGIANADDACPLQAGLPELKGCAAKDSDGDGLPDHLDRCPDQAGASDNQGCPRVVVEKEQKKVELREKVQFDVGQATIKPESRSLLDEIASVMKQHPEIKSVVIEGHTDASGSAAVNRRLSQARADSVLNALVERGVEKARLAAKGFGPSRPIASNDTPEGREANRRVEISIAQSE
jgi:outer membrane protein OmpA-like peptidoglycan-associated protein